MAAMAQDTGRLSGVEKAAIVLMNMGEELASEVFKHMSQQEIQVIATTIIKKDHMSSQVGRDVVTEFVRTCSTGETKIEGIEFAKNAILKALGPEKAQDIIEHLTREAGSGGIEAIKWMDPAVLANIIRYEHPQIIALILAHLEPEKGSQVLLNLPEERVRAEVLLRVATLKTIPPAAVKDLEVLLNAQALVAGSTRGSSVEGVKVAAEILNRIDQQRTGAILETIEKTSPDMAVKIQEKMFVFTDLLTIDDKGMQLVIKELTTDILSVALKGSEEGIQQKFFANMSERAAEMLKEDIENKGPVRVSDVEKAQMEIIRVARKLEQEGKIMRAGKGGEVLI